jgi:hypothetical protein
MIFNDEQWEVIKQAGPHFRTAKQDYIRNAPQFITNEIVKVYEEATGKTVMNKDSHCSVCVLRIYQQIGKAYFADLEERNKKQNEIENEKGNNNKKNGTPDNGNQKKKKGSSSKVQGRVVKKKNS